MNANIARLIGEITWWIASLAGGEFVLRGFEIEGTEVREVELVVE